MTNEQLRARQQRFIRFERRNLLRDAQTSKSLQMRGGANAFDVDAVAGVVFRDLHRANACVERAAKRHMHNVPVPPCAASMGCLCAGHARDFAAEFCDTRE